MSSSALTALAASSRYAAFGNESTRYLEALKR